MVYEHYTNYLLLKSVKKKYVARYQVLNIRKLIMRLAGPFKFEMQAWSMPVFPNLFWFAAPLVGITHIWRYPYLVY